ncbi:MAG: GNAT family N-acetyltransferase [Patescibacteria group bacterium]
MNIRKAITSDIDAIHALGSAVEEFSVSNKVVTFWPKHILLNCANSETDLLLIAEEKDEIIGFIIVNNSLVFKKAIVENIFVSPRFREQGAAKKLLTVALDLINATDCEYICALMDDDKAIQFYESNGFKKGRNFAWLDKVISKEFSKS